VEVAVVEVDIKYELVILFPRISPATERSCPGDVVPIPTFPPEVTVRAVVVALVLGSANIEKRGRLESEEVAEIVKTEIGEVVPIPKLPVEVATLIWVTVQLEVVGAQPGSRVSPGANSA